MQKVRPWELWDWKTIRNVFALLIVVGGVSLFSFRFPDWLRNSKNELTEVTNGTLIKAESLKQLYMGRQGNDIGVSGVAIDYSYVIDGVTYYSTDKIPNSVEHQKFFKKLNNTRTLPLRVKYNPTNPQQSQIDTNTD